MNDWLTDIFTHSEGGRTAVCAVCKQKEVSGDQIFPVCNRCDTGVGDVTRRAQESLHRPLPSGFRKGTITNPDGSKQYVYDGRITTDPWEIEQAKKASS
jgi:hypothetical protein